MDKQKNDYDLNSRPKAPSDSRGAKSLVRFVNGLKTSKIWALLGLHTQCRYLHTC